MAHPQGELKTHHSYGTDPEGRYREWLEERARECRLVAEVGVLSGRTTIRLAEACPGVVYAVDSWRLAPGDPVQDAIYKNLERSEAVFRQKLAGHIETGKVVVVKMDSTEAATELARRVGPVFDLVFLDADHRYQKVRADILAWRGMVRSGGILSGHDVGWPGVREAVRELVPDWEPGLGSIWWRRMP